MDFGFSEEQEMLRQSAREFLEAECPMTYVRQMMEDERGYSEEQWRKMAELGWTGLIVPEEYGGAGLNMVDMVVVLEEMGTVVLAGRRSSRRLMLGGMAIDLGGREEQKQRSCPRIARRRTARDAGAGLEESGRWDAEGIAAGGARPRRRLHCSRHQAVRHDAHNADSPGRAGAHRRQAAPDGITLFAIDAKRAGRRGDAAQDDGPDAQARARSTFDNVEAVGSRRRAARSARAGALLDRRDRPRQGRAVRRDVRRRAEGARDERRVRQGARAVRQARSAASRPIQHKCANMMVQVESAKSATYYAAWAVANDVAEAHLAAVHGQGRTPPTPTAASAAEGIQIHGGIGFTWEHDMHLYFKRAKGSEVTFGDATWNRELVAQLIGL